MSNGKVLQKLKSEETIVDNFIKCAAKWRQKEDACYLKWQPRGEPLPLSAELGNAYMVSLLDMDGQSFNLNQNQTRALDHSL